MALLEVSNLSIQLQTHRGLALAVRDVSFTLERGATLGLIGESGCDHAARRTSAAHNKVIVLITQMIHAHAPYRCSD